MFKSARIVPTVILGLLLILLVPAVSAAERSSEQEKVLGIEQLIGSWRGTTNLGTTVLLSFHADRTYSVTFNLPGTGAGHGHGHGAWKRTGAATFALTDISLILDPDNELILIQKTQADATVDDDEAEFELVVTLSLPDGTPVGTATGTAEATRIEVEPIP